MKPITLFVILFLSFSSEKLFAQQKQGAWWYFGIKAGLNFNTQPPSPDFAGQATSNTGCASVSDAHGNLLFYADGIKVYNNLHQVMPNGNILAQGTVYTRVLIVQKPGSAHLYYLFSITSPNANTPNLFYSIIDMRLDGGKGDIIASSKKILLFSVPVAPKITTALHANNRDAWIVVHSDTGIDYYSFLISPTGIGSPVTSSIGLPYTNSGYMNVMKSSPNSGLVADVIGSIGASVQLLDLNRSAGILTNPRTFPHPSYLGGPQYSFVAFSPDNTKLYLSTTVHIYQFNLSAGSFQDILNSRFQVDKSNTYYQDMQLALNGKLYILLARRPPIGNNISQYISVINCPNQLGFASNFQDTTIFLGRHGGGDLPALNQILFRNANFLQLTAPESYTCIGKPIKLSAFGAGADNFTWLPANGLTPANSPEVLVSPSVTTTYTVIGYSQCDSDTASITINVVPPAFANAGNDKVICQSGSVSLGGTPTPGLTYAWNASPFLSDTTLANPVFTATNTTSVNQVYQLILSIDGPGVSCGKRTDTVQVTVRPQITVNAGAPVSFCAGTSVQLNPQQFNASYTYSWSPTAGLSNPNSFAPTLSLTNFSAQPDTVFYTLTATSNGCSASSQIRVVVLPQPKPVVHGPASVCPGSPQIAYAVSNHLAGTTYTWGIRGGTISQSFNDSIQVNWGGISTTGMVWLKAQNTFNCQSDTVFFPVMINPLLLTETPKGNATLCANDRLNQLYQVARAQGSAYNWGITGGSILSGQGSHQVRVNWQGSGQHKLWVQESAQTSLAQCFGVSDTLRVSVLPSPDTTLLVQGPAAACHQTQQTYSLAGNSNSVYQWQVVGGSILGGQGSNTISVSWQTVGLGQVKVLETLPNGCEGIWRTLNVQVNPLPQPLITGNFYFCPEALQQTYQVQGQAGSAFQWQITGGTMLSGQGTSQATILWDSLGFAPHFTVTETTLQGCANLTRSPIDRFDQSSLELLAVGLDEGENQVVVQYLVKDSLHYPGSVINILVDKAQAGQWQLQGQPNIANTITAYPVANPYRAVPHRLQGTNRCGTVMLSQVHRPVELNANSNDNSGEVKLNWNSYKGWQVITRYEIWQKLEGQTAFERLTVTTDTSITLPTGSDGFRQRYRIKAVSEFGYESWSNSVGLTFENKLDLPNIITPNNDGRNETFTAKSLLLYPNSSLKIYNRWGKEVFSSLNYKGEWNAKDQPAGVYYYLLQTAEGKSFKGWVEVVR